MLLDSEERRLFVQWGDLTPGDRSVLTSALATADAEMLTAPGSGNDHFWSSLVGLGLLDGPLEPAWPASKRFRVREGRLLKQLIDRFETRNREQFERMRLVFNEVCEPFAQGFVDEVGREGGARRDLMALTVFTLASIIRKSFDPSDYAEVIDNVARLTKANLKV